MSPEELQRTVAATMVNTNRALEQRVRAQLAALQDQSLLRSLEEPAGLDLCSNDYLGLARHPRMRRRLAEAVRSLGVGSTGSRLLRGHRAAFEAVEERFARLKSAPAALYLGSGWAANLGVLSTFPTSEDVIFSDELNHASLIDGMRLSRARHVVYPHCDCDALSRLLESEPCSGQRFVVTESLFSMDGDIAPLQRLGEMQAARGFALVVDEAHAMGVYGRHGSGLIEETGCGDGVFLSINSAGKALGVSGAFVCGPSWAIQLLVQSARPFVFSTAPPPALAEAIDEALDLLQDEPERRVRVLEYGTLLREALDLAPSNAPIVPLIIGSSAAAVQTAASLRAEGYDVRAIRPPTVPAGTARLRVSLNADLSRAELAGVAGSLKRALERRA